MGNAEWEMKGGRDGRGAGRIGDPGRERGVSGVGGSPRLGLIFKPPANLQLSQHTPSGAGFPWFLGACSGKFPEVRSSEQAIGTYPHNRFHDQTPYEHTWLIYLQRPIISMCLSDPQSAVTELTLPRASPHHPQTYRYDLLANPFLTS